MKNIKLLLTCLSFIVVFNIHTASDAPKIKVSSVDRFMNFLRSAILNSKPTNNESSSIFPLKQLLDSDSVLVDIMMKNLFTRRDSNKIISTMKLTGDKELFRIINKYFDSYKGRYGSEEGQIPMSFVWRWYGFKTLELKGYNSFIKSLLDVPRDVAAIKISHNNTFIAIASVSGDAKIFDITGKLLHVLKNNDIGVVKLEISSNDSFIVTGSLDNIIRIWDSKTGKMIRAFHVQGGGIGAISISQDCKFIVNSDHHLKGSSVKIWDFNTGKLINKINNIDTYIIFPINLVKISKNNTSILAASISMTGKPFVSKVQVFDFSTGKELYSLSFKDLRVISVEMNNDETELAIAFSNGRLDKYNLKEESLISEAPTLGLTSYDVIDKTILQMSNDYSFVVERSAMYEKDSIIKIRDRKSNNLIYRLPKNSGSSTVVVISNDNRFIVAGSDNGTFNIWHLNII